PSVLTRILLSGVFRFWPNAGVCVVNGLRNGTKVTVLPALRASVPMVRLAAEPRPAPLCWLKDDGPGLSSTVPSAAAGSTAGVLFQTKLNVALFSVTLAGVAPDIRRPPSVNAAGLRLAALALSSVREVPAPSVTPDVFRICPTPVSVSAPAVTVVAPVCVSAAARAMVPAPTLVRPPAPLMAPVNVTVFCVLLRMASLARTTLPVQVLAWLAMFWNAPGGSSRPEAVRPRPGPFTTSVLLAKMERFRVPLLGDVPLGGVCGLSWSVALLATTTLPVGAPSGLTTGLLVKL